MGKTTGRRVGIVVCWIALFGFGERALAQVEPWLQAIERRSSVRWLGPSWFQVAPRPEQRRPPSLEVEVRYAAIPWGTGKSVRNLANTEGGPARVRTLAAERPVGTLWVRHGAASIAGAEVAEGEYRLHFDLDDAQRWSLVATAISADGVGEREVAGGAPAPMRVVWPLRILDAAEVQPRLRIDVEPLSGYADRSKTIGIDIAFGTYRARVRAAAPAESDGAPREERSPAGRPGRSR